ncbi:MAG: hypothetical protein ATN33_00960 [Epulopiscium sp. Nele67-Bin001]|nr:MAG: hypothetical protein ATN33_00960 [Epulopiscium sp. Nele67-Bin001]
MSKKLLAVAVMAAMSMSALTGCSANEPVNNVQAAVSSDVVAVVNGISISESLYRAYLWSAQSFFEMQLGTPMSSIVDMEIEGQTIGDLAKERALESAILSVVATQEAAELDIELTQDEISELEGYAADFMAINGEIANTYRFSEDDIVKLLIGTEYSTKVQDKIGSVYMPSEEEILAEIEEAKYYYEAVTARHILISTVDEMNQPLDEEAKAEKLALANELLDRIKAGEDIGELAGEYSEDPGSAYNNGEYTFGRGRMVAEFEEAAFSAADGEIWPEPIETSYGYHIGQTIEFIPANEEQIREEYITFARMIFAEDELITLMEAANVEKTALFDDITLLTPEQPQTDEVVNNETVADDLVVDEADVTGEIVNDETVADDLVVDEADVTGEIVNDEASVADEAVDNEAIPAE